MISELGKKILFLIIYSSDFVISSELSRICNASISTIRKEIEILNEYLEDKGCHIDSKTSQGYCLMIDSELKSNDFIKRFLNNYHRLNYTKEFKFSSAYFMIRKLLTSSKTISVDDLASELYVSKSTILRNLSHVREILSPFSLDLKTVRNKGIEIKGDEWNKRLCLILMRRIHILNHSTSYLNESTFESQFMINSGIVRTINHVLRNALQEFPSVKFAGIEMPKICNLILLNSTRNQFASQITFNSTQQNRIFHSLEYELAKVIYHKLPELFHDDYLPQNTMILAAYLIGSRSYTSIQQLDKFDALKYKKETEKIIQFFSLYYDISNLFDNRFTEDFICYLASLNNRLLFCMISDKETIASATSTGMFTNDLCSLFASYYYTQKKILLEESDLAQAYFIINRSIVENRNLYVKKKILVSSRYGIFNARRVALAIQKKYSPYLSTIDTCEFSDLFNINLSAYDLLATDENSVRYVNQYRESPVAIKHLTFSSFRSSNDFKQLNQYFDVTNKQDALQIFKKDNIHKIEIHSEDDVYSFLTQFYSEQLIHSEQFVQSIKMRNHFINPEREKGIIMLSTLAYKLSQPTFELIIPSNEFVWNQRKVNLIIFYQHGDGTTENRTLISLLCSQFIHQPEAYLSQLINMEYESMLNDFKPDKYI